MAPPPEYDKEPKAPDKSATNISIEDSKLLHNLVNDHHTNSDQIKPTSTVAVGEVENNKHVETLDDGQLRALLDEAITYRKPKDREGKSNLFKELLEEVEVQDEQACEAAARSLTRSRRGRGRRALPHSSSMQDLVAAALAAEPAPSARRPKHAPPAPASVSARAIHGGSLPSGVDTSSLLSEEPARAGYLATVRCVNPPPLAERRVSASDAKEPGEMELLNRRNKPMLMTYTARATLEIGSGSVSSGRAVTTTTASNQVRTHRRPQATDTRRERQWAHTVAKWYDGLSAYSKETCNALTARCNKPPSITEEIFQETHSVALDTSSKDIESETFPQKSFKHQNKKESPCLHEICACQDLISHVYKREEFDIKLRKNPNKLKFNSHLIRPSLSSINPRNIRPMSVSLPPNHGMNIPLETDAKAIEAQLTTNEAQKEKSNSLDNITIAFDDENSSIDAASTDRTECCEMLNIFSKEQNIPMELQDMSRNTSTPDKVLEDWTTMNDMIEITDFNSHQHNTNTESKFSEYLTNQQRLLDSLKYDSKHNFSTVDVDSEKQNEGKLEEHSLLLANKKRETESATNKNILQSIDDNTQDNVSRIITLKDNSSSLDAARTDATECCEMLNIFSEEHNVPIAQDMYKNIILRDMSRNTSNPDEVLEDRSMMNCHSYMIELSDFNSHHHHKSTGLGFSDFLTNQQRLLNSLKCDIKSHYSIVNVVSEKQKEEQLEEHSLLLANKKGDTGSAPNENILQSIDDSDYSEVKPMETIENSSTISSILTLNQPIAAPLNTTQEINATSDNNITSDLVVYTQLPNDYIALTLPKSFLTQLSSKDVNSVYSLHSENNNSIVKFVVTDKSATNISRTTKEKSALVQSKGSGMKKNVTNRNILKVYENLFRNIITEKISTDRGVATLGEEEVDSAISFSCITTPEVVTGCNTTASGEQAAVAVDPKPRSVLGSFNGLAAARPAPADDYKKSLDENGNSVQGISSPLSGSSHKKPRRKKSSKNETVIDCQQIDGYQGDKDVNELLRFIESDAEHSRAKLPRAKHKDDADDKGKKRSASRKDKEAKPKRASSLDELSRARPPAPAPERRSWADERRDDEPPPADTDFQTVTKRRKPRRAQAEPPEPRRARPPSPRRSDRSDRSDSNDDEPPPPRARAPAKPHASYADIARTRHNIPDLIESCNFYGDEAGARRADYPALAARRAARPPRARKPPPAPAPPAAPDLVQERPAVVLLDAGARAPDMDGVTFGFDVNEQLLGAARRPRCDLLRHAPALRYVPPAPPADARPLLQLVDYVGAAWEDVLRCGAGKVRYYSE